MKVAPLTTTNEGQTYLLRDSALVFLLSNNIFVRAGILGLSILVTSGTVLAIFFRAAAWISCFRVALPVGRASLYRKF